MSSKRRSKASPARSPRSNGVRPAQFTRDTFANPYLRIGPGQRDLLESSQQPLTRMTQNYPLLNSLYRNDWIARRVIDALPEDMTKNWYKLKSQIAPDQGEQLARIERKCHIKQRILEGLRWGRLYGGAAGVMVIDGQQDMLDAPLDLDMVMPGQFKGLVIADRWSGVYPGTEIVDDIGDPDFGTPEYYTFAISESDILSGVRVHHSRILRFIGRDLPYIERLAETYWGMSELEHIYTELNKRNTTSANIARLIFQANLRTYKMSDLGQMLAATDPQTQSELYQTIAAQNMLMSSLGINVMDKDDEFQTNQYTFAGISDIYETFMLDIAGAAETPVTRLFGRSAAGMDATGEGDLINYYDKVRQLQQSTLRPVLEKLLPVMCVSAWGALPDDLDFEFNPVRDTSEKERADLIQQSAAAITSVYQAGMISQQTALKELRQSGVSYGMWSNITDTDIDCADALPDTPRLLPEQTMGAPPDAHSAAEAPANMASSLAEVLLAGGGPPSAREPPKGDNQ